MIPEETPKVEQNPAEPTPPPEPEQPITGSPPPETPPVLETPPPTEVIEPPQPEQVAPEPAPEPIPEQIVVPEPVPEAAPEPVEQKPEPVLVPNPEPVAQPTPLVPEVNGLPTEVAALSDEHLKIAAAYYLRKNQKAIGQKGVAARQQTMNRRMDEIAKHVQGGTDKLQRIAKLTNLSPGLTAHYLQILVKQGRIKAEGHGTTRRYSP